MKRYKIYIDITDIYKDITKLNIRNYSDPFLVLFIEAHNPDDACHQCLINIKKEIIRAKDNITNRIFCRLIKKYVRFDKVIQL